MFATHRGLSFPILTRWALALVLGITFLVYVPSLTHEFVDWDDGTHLTATPLVRSLSLTNVQDIFGGLVQDTYIPLTTLSFALEYRFFGYNSFIYHLNNVLLHVAVTALVFLLGLAFLRRSSLGLAAQIQAAAVAGLIFGLHPMHVESVSWVTERKDVLYSLFYLLSLWVYERRASVAGRDAQAQQRRRKLYLLSLLFGLLSILAKSMALSLPLILLVLDWHQNGKLTRRALMEKIPFFLIIVPIAWITYSPHARVPFVNPAEGALVWLSCLAFYLKKFFLPLNLSPLYTPAQPVSLSNFAYLHSVLVVLFATLVTIIFRKNRWLMFAVMFFFGSIFFLLRSDLVEKNIMFDRFIYLPSLGFCLWMGYTWSSWTERIAAPVRQRIYPLAALIIVLGGACQAQQSFWTNTLTLWTRVIERSPSEAMAYASRGIYFTDKRLYQRALADQNKALALNPFYADAYTNRGLIFERLGHLDAALEDYDQALKIAPQDKITLNNRGLLYLRLNHYDLALKDFNLAIALENKYPAAYNNRGLVFEKQGRMQEALNNYQTSVALDPSYSDGHNNLGNIYRRQGDLEKAISHYSRAISFNSENEKSRNNRGVAYAEAGRPDLALADYNQALKLDPQFTKVYNNRAIVLEQLDRPDEAFKDYEQALSQDPNYFDAYRNRGILYYRRKEFDLALKDFNRALEINPQSGLTYYTRSLVYMETGNYSGALADAHTAQSLGEDVTAYLNHLRTISSAMPAPPTDKPAEGTSAKPTKTKSQAKH